MLLDHGLYKELDRDFRVDYARLWQAIVLTDVREIEKQCIKLGAGDMYPLLAAMLTARPWDEISQNSMGRLNVTVDDADRAMISGYAQRYAFEISDMLNKVPRQVCLFAST